MNLAKKYPKISIIMPTLNSERTLDQSLSSINSQDYPGLFEVIIADGGSKDKTLEIAKKYRVQIIKNKLKTGEAGKAIGVKSAKGEIIAFIDSDNILPEKDWLEKMTRPFVEDSEIIASEPLYFTYRKSDHFLTRYFAMLGMGDPLNLFIGNYDRYSYISNKWTELKLKVKDEGHFLKVYLRDQMPTIGANGFLIKVDEIKKYQHEDYLFDIDVLKFLAKDHEIKVAKVKVGIIHLFTGDIVTFIRKQRRRIRDFMYFSKVGIRETYHSPDQIFAGVIKFSFATITIVPILFQTIQGYSRKADVAWMFHPVACFLTLYVYCTEMIRSFFIKEEFDRRSWHQ